MNKSELNLLSHCIEALLEVQENLDCASASRLIQKAKSAKEDSLHLDTSPEITLSKKLIDEYDSDITLITEEKGVFNSEGITRAQIVVFADPTDRSKQLKEFIEEHLVKADNPDIAFGDLLQSIDAVDEWEKLHSGPSSITGACCALTVVKHGEILFSTVLNYITRQIFVAADRGVHCATTASIRASKSRDFPNAVWQPLAFPSSSRRKHFVAFLGKESYEEYLKKSDVLGKLYTPLEKEPGGPLRILYLSALHPDPTGFILSNGEKIAEWLGWLAFVKATDDLTAYSIYPEAVFARDDILLGPPPLYSILEVDSGVLRLNFSKLKYFENPSRYREMILVTHKTNTGIAAEIEANRTRELPL